MQPYDGTGDMRWLEPESSAAFAWLTYMAHAKFDDAKYLQAATSAMDALNANTDNPHYACILPFGAYIAARMNAEQGTSYDTTRILNWCFEGGHICIGGVSAARWGDYDVTGLVQMYDDRPYLFETFQLASAIVPLVRYDPRLARAVGKWMLNAASSARLFYPGELPDDYQVAADLKSISKNLISYEVLLGRDAKHLTPAEAKLFDTRKGVPFVAARDNWDTFSPVTGERYVFPPVSNFSVYSSTSVGIFGAIISPTSDEKILALDCLKTDFFHAPAYPTHLYFNPYREDKQIEIALGSMPVDLYDAVSKRWLKKAVAGKTTVLLPQDSAALIVQVPAGAQQRTQGTKSPCRRRCRRLSAPEARPNAPCNDQHRKHAATPSKGRRPAFRLMKSTLPRPPPHTSCNPAASTILTAQLRQSDVSSRDIARVPADSPCAQAPSGLSFRCQIKETIPMQQFSRREVLKLGVLASTVAVAPRWVGPAQTPMSARNIALNRAAWASSSADVINTGHMSTDGRLTTKWQSADADPQWIYVDLGAACNLHSVVLRWGANLRPRLQAPGLYRSRPLAPNRPCRKLD